MPFPGKQISILACTFMAMLAVGAIAFIIRAYFFPQLIVTAFVDTTVFRSKPLMLFAAWFLQPAALALILLFLRKAIKYRYAASLTIVCGMSLMAYGVWSAVKIDEAVLGSWLIYSTIQTVAGESMIRFLETKRWKTSLLVTISSVSVILFTGVHFYYFPAPFPDETKIFPLETGTIKVDVFEPRGDQIADGAAIIILHGVEGSTELSRGLIHYPNSRSVADRGYRTYFVRYLEPTGFQHLLDANGEIDLEYIDYNRLKNYRKWIDSVKTVIKAIAKMPETDPNRIAIVGYSLGCFVGTAVTAEWQGEGCPCLMVGNFGAMWEEIEVGDKFPAAQFHHIAGDKVVVLDEVKAAVARINKTNKNRAELFVYPGNDHTPTGEIGFAIRRTTEEFLAKHLRNPAQ